MNSWLNELNRTQQEEKEQLKAQLVALKGGDPSGRADHEDPPKRVDDQNQPEYPSSRVSH